MSKAVNKTYAVTVANMAYQIENIPNKTIYLVRGRRYVFEIAATGHPFWIQTSGSGFNSVNVYSNGVNNNGTQLGNIIFDIPADAPDTLYYQCQYHPSMVGTLKIIDEQTGQSFETVDPSSPTVEDLVDKVFYGLRQNRLTSKASVDTIAGDEPIRLPNQYSTRTDDYVNWMWSYNRFVYSYNAETGHLLMEVL